MRSERAPVGPDVQTRLNTRIIRAIRQNLSALRASLVSTTTGGPDETDCSPRVPGARGLGRRGARPAAAPRPAAGRERHVAVPAARSADAERLSDRLRPARPALLAAAGGLHHPRVARHRDAERHGRGDDPVHQQLARHAALRLDAAGPEQRLGGQQVRRPEPGVRSPRARLRRRIRAGAGRRAAGRTSRREAGVHGPRLPRRRDDDAGGAGQAAAAQRRGVVRRRLALHGAALRSDGPRALPRGMAVRDRAVVPAHGGVRRRARLEHRPVSGQRRVLPRVRRLRLQHHGARRLHGDRHGRPAEPGAGADRRGAAAARARGEVGHDDPHHREGRGRDARRCCRPARARRGPGTSRRRTSGTCRGPQRPTSSGTRRGGTGS